MKTAFLTLSALVLYVQAFAQTADEPEVNAPGKASIAYHEYRGRITRPPYGLQKILALIDKNKGDEDGNVVIPAKIYASLSLREKFTYHMVHGESYAQNCDGGFVTQHEEKKIFAELPGVFDEEYWTDRQKKFFVDNHDSIVALMTESIRRTKRVGVNFKRVMANINAAEMIPLLIGTYNADKKDHDILTLLMLLMKNNRYPPFMASASYKKLYADKETSWKNYLTFNTANEELIIQRATDFYNGLAKKG